MRLANKIAIITGAGSGIGQASAYLFAEEGAKVVVADIKDTESEKTVATIKASGCEAIFVHTDVSVASEVEHLIKETKSKFGKIDILFNNAGIAPRTNGVESIDESEWDRIHAVNVKSVFLGAKYVVPEMKKAGGGVIINTASMAGIRPRVYHVAYSSSKGAVNILTKALAIELAPHNIRVNCINPGVVKTPIMKPYTPPGMDFEEWIKPWVDASPLRRFIEAKEVAYAALYLASDESSMVTGSCINVDGGRGI